MRLQAAPSRRRRRLTRTLPIVTLIASICAALLATTPVTALGRVSQGTGAGGKAVAHRAGGQRVKARGAPRAAFYRVGLDATEPTLGIDADKRIYYVAAGDLSPVILRSDDAGETWDDFSPKVADRNAHPITLDPYVYMDESTNRLFTIDLTVACSYLSFSDDSGESWTTNPLACGRPINDHQTLFSGPPALSPTTVYDEIVYYCWNDFGLGTSCSKSLDGGLSWLAGNQAFFGYDSSEGNPDQCGGFNGHGVVGSDGTVYLPKEYCGQPWLGISRDEGLTWERVQVATNGTERLGSDTSVAVDDKGNLYYVYETEDQYIYLVTSTDGGKTWSKPMMAGFPGVNEVNLPTLDVGEPGKVAIAYMGSENSPFAQCQPDCTREDYMQTTWNGYITMSVNALDADPLFFSASTNDPADPLYRGQCDFFSGRCSPVLDFIDIEISPDGTPYAAFVDACMASCVEGGALSGGEGTVGRLVGGPPLR